MRRFWARIPLAVALVFLQLIGSGMESGEGTNGFASAVTISQHEKQGSTLEAAAGTRVGVGSKKHLFRAGVHVIGPGFLVKSHFHPLLRWFAFAISVPAENDEAGPEALKDDHGDPLPIRNPSQHTLDIRIDTTSDTLRGFLLGPNHFFTCHIDL